MLECHLFLHIYICLLEAIHARRTSRSPGAGWRACRDAGLPYGVWKVKAAAPRPRDAIVARQQPAKIIFTRLCSHVEHIHICIIFYMLYDIILYLICLILC